MMIAHVVAIAWPHLNAHALSSFLHAEYASGLFIINIVQDCRAGLEELPRHEKVFCDGELGRGED